MTTYKPGFSEFFRLTQKGNLIPVYCEFLADTQTPVAAALKLNDEENLFLLESVEGREKWATYSFLGIRPSWIFSCQKQNVTLFKNGKKSTKKVNGNPLNQIEKMLSKYNPVNVSGIPRFFGGAVGYISYDAVRYFENIPSKGRKEFESPDAFFMFADTMIVFNNFRQIIQIIANVYVPPNCTKAKAEQLYREAVDQVQNLKKRLTENPFPRKTKRGKVSAAKASMSKKEYMDGVKRIKSYIHQGDIIQAVFSNRFQGTTDVDPLQVYRALRLINPSPYMYYFRYGKNAIVGSSPETLVRLEDEEITVRPIAGTRRRGKSEVEDQNLANDLLHDEKERAEHIMLVDLGRNDIGRVSQKGSVKVTDFMTIERYSHVMHIVSNVCGRLNQSLNRIDALGSTFPAGTLSGAPKIRAMEIIDELEPVQRGIYGGAIGYFSFSGSMDFAIAIRTIFFENGHYYYQAGAGIVADSDPQAEYQECENKAKAVAKALNMGKHLE